MTLSITLSPTGGLRLILPTGRFLDLGHEPSSLKFVQRILRDAGAGKRDQRGYIGEFPTQHVIEIWKKQAKQAADEAAFLAREAAMEKFAEAGIDLAGLDIQL